MCVCGGGWRVRTRQRFPSPASFSNASTGHALNSSDQVSANTTLNLNDSFKYKTKREVWKSKGFGQAKLFCNAVPSIEIGFAKTTFTK